MRTFYEKNKTLELMSRLRILWGYTEIFHSFQKHIKTSKTYRKQGKKCDKKRKKRSLDYVFRLFNCFHQEVSVFFYYLKENVFHCITSILLLEQKQAIMCVNI